MKRKNCYSYLLIALLLCGCLNIPNSFIDSFRGWIVYLNTPTWKVFSFIRRSLTPSHPFTLHQQRLIEEKLEKLETENKALINQNKLLKKRLSLEEESFTFSPVFAQVVYRQPSSWNSFIWINVGKETHPTVELNSPVLSENALVGIVEMVGKKHSRVRLITDSSIAVSVRALRGSEQKQEIIQLIDQLMLYVSLQKEAIFSYEEERSFFKEIETFKQRLQIEKKTIYLAKGELFGTSSPLWRSRSSTLKGVGFNYDFEDEKGPARELRTGKPYGKFFQDMGITLIQEGDLLVTTGMDGLFPPNIPVAVVSKVETLKEGAASFSIEAKLCSKKVNDLATVVVFPSLRLDLEEKS